MLMLERPLSHYWTSPLKGNTKQAFFLPSSPTDAKASEDFDFEYIVVEFMNRHKLNDVCDGS